MKIQQKGNKKMPPPTKYGYSRIGIYIFGKTTEETHTQHVIYRNMKSTCI